MKLLVDSSFFILCADVGRDFVAVLEDYLGECVELLVPQAVLDELRSLSGRRGRLGRLARVALKLASQAGVVENEPSKSADDALMESARRLNLPVLTVDRKLLQALRGEGIPAVTLSKTGRPRVILEPR
ncbi:MAG: hypothetical protein NXY59_02575 [Aigarchaeota archaeon]|nr:hypothetical protein [Candidatus Pelearchaeum maunauluense]